MACTAPSTQLSVPSMSSNYASVTIGPEGISLASLSFSMSLSLVTFVMLNRRLLQSIP